MGDNSTITSVSLGRGRDVAGPQARPYLVLVTISDEPTLASSRHLLDDVDEVRFGRGARGATRAMKDGKRVLELAVSDRRMSTDHGRLLRTQQGWVLNDPDSKNGAIVDGELCRRAVLRDGTWIELGHTLFWFDTGVVERPDVPDVDADQLAPPAPMLATFDGELARQFAGLAKIAPSPVPVLFAGATGTGKEVVARALHELSGRTGPFVAVNCGAIPSTLLEDELFGHRKGAFSGAVTERVGLVRRADRGTLFLDEIGELPPASQTAFLRVLQEQEVVPVGEDRAIKVDVRVCAATLRDLDAMVDAGTFRADLYARLMGYSVTLPPLCERSGDFGLILRSLLTRIGADRARFDPPALRALVRHPWPLNVRELEKCLTTAKALWNDGLIELEHLPANLREAPKPAAADSLDDEDRRLHGQLVSLLRQHEGNVLAVAAELGKRRMQVYRWLKRLNIDVDEFRKR